MAGMSLRKGIELKSWKAPGDHPFSEMVRDWLRSRNIEPETLEQESETCVNWHFTTDPGLSVVASIYKTPDTEIFFLLEVALAWIHPGSEHGVLHWLARKNCGLPHPFRLACLEALAVVVQCRSYCDGFTKEHFQLRLDTLVPFATEIQSELARSFGLRPYLEAGPRIGSGEGGR